MDLLRLVLKIGVEKYGEIVDVFRGDNNPVALKNYKILYGSTNERIAAFYGSVLNYRAKGLQTFSEKRSVFDDGSFDEEIIFFPETICN